MLFFNVFFKTLGFFCAILIFIIIINILLNSLENLNKNNFVLVDGNEDSENIIATINLNGPIFNNSINILENNLYSFINPKYVKNYLEELKKLNVNVLIVNINSPGGTLTATAELENIFYNFKKETNTKIYFFTKEILASGGYWIGTSADKIYASYGAVIGSIGVSGPSWYYYNNPISLSSGILGQTIETKKGIEVFNQNAGQGKDLFNPYRRPTNDEIQHLQKIVDEVYNDFLRKVSKSRKIEISFVEKNIGALIYSSNQAKEKYLIDGILNYEKLIKNIIKENNFENYKIYENIKRQSLIENLIISYNNYYYKNVQGNICKKFETSINLVTPLFLRNC